MRKAIVSLMRMVSGLALISTTSYGAVEFIAGNENVGVGGNVSVPVTVTGFADVTTLQFSFYWDKDVIQFSSIGSYGLPGMLDSFFGKEEVNNGYLTASWNGDATTVADGSRIFAINFTGVGTVGSHSAILFTNWPTEIEVTVNFGPAGDVLFTDGGVTVVPEPINAAFVVFGGIFVGAMTVRWISRKRLALRTP